MKTQSTGTGAAGRGGSALGRIVLLAGTALLAAPVALGAADPKAPPAGAKSAAVTLEPVPGSSVLRVTLTPKAAERLGIETAKVSEEQIVRRQMVSGLIVSAPDRPPPSGPAPAAKAAAKPAPTGFADFSRIGAAPAAAPAPQPVVARASAPTELRDAWVLVSLSPRELERLAREQPARVLPLATREKGAKEVVAEPAQMAPVEDPKRSMLSLYYRVPGKDHGLAEGSRVRVELPLAGANGKQKVVPYGAVFYDAKGTAWVYVVTKPLTFERQRIGVERVVGDHAVLSEGPAVGTPIVAVGAALLYGAEIFKK